VEVATWLAATYRSKIQLTGILYLHRITDIRMGGCAVQNLRMFKKMCGQSCLPNVVLLTTMWGGSTQQVSIQEAREMELKSQDEFWAGLIRLGARCERYDNTKARGLAIVKQMLSRPKIVLEIQRQIVEEGKNLSDTAAGQQLCEDIIKAEAKAKKDLQDAKEEMTEALRQKDMKTAEEMKKTAAHWQSKLDQMDRDRNHLEENLQRSLEQHQEIVRHMQSNQKAKWMAVGVGVALAALTGGLGMLAGVAIAGVTGTTAMVAGGIGTGAALAGVSGAAASSLTAAQIAGALGRQAIMSATQGAIQLGAQALAGANRRRLSDASD